MRERLTAALKEATEAHDKRRVNTLRLIGATIKDRDMAARAAGKERLTDDDVTAILMKMIKQRKESAKGYEEEGRIALADEELEEIAIIRSFLPAQLSDGEIQSVCAKAIEDTDSHSLRDLGKCMAELKARYPHQVDFAKAIQIVKQRLQ
ncbi:MAG: GatB/YqeY domain-containing protein [Bauldia sp.]|nr:GatB/YqeY domain-containing protein [Bauldia sp.]